ncbi:hypothetical protein [Nocardia sp. NPDC057030]|uniref:hypothetical protein n=1 Tax=unclassified Nocardia TaxID=2637762 RepID=UPI00363CDDFA
MNYGEAIRRTLQQTASELSRIVQNIPDISELERHQIKDAVGAIETAEQKLGPVAHFLDEDRRGKSDRKHESKDAAPAITAASQSSTEAAARGLNPEAVGLYGRVLNRSTPSSTVFVESLLEELSKQQGTGIVRVDKLQELIGQTDLRRMTISLNRAFKNEIPPDEMAEHKIRTSSWRLIRSHKIGDRHVTHYSLAPGAYDPLTAALKIHKAAETPLV